MVCPIENQTESRKDQGDHVLQVQTRQKNITQPKTVWRDTKSLGPLQHQVPPIKATS